MTSQVFANLALVFSICVLASTWFSNKLKDKESDAALTKKTDEIKAMQIVHQKELQEKTDKIEGLQNDLIALQDHGLQKMEHQINLLTGGDSFPILMLTQDAATSPNVFSGTLIVSGNYPIKNFTMRLTATQNGKSTDLGSQKVIDSLRQMSPNDIGKILDLNKDPNASLRATFFADNGVWIQRFEFKKDESGVFQYRTTVEADQQKGTPPLLVKEFHEGVKFGTFDNWRTTQYKGKNP